MLKSQSVADLKQLHNNFNLLKERPFSQVAKLKKLAVEDLVKTSLAQRFPFLIKLVQDTDKDTVDYSDFLKEWTNIMDSLKDKKKHNR